MAGRLLNRHRDSLFDCMNAVYIGRGTPYGNPFSVGRGAASREEAIWRFENEILPSLDLTPLLGSDLLCSCTPKPCHGNPILWALYRGL